MKEQWMQYNSIWVEPFDIIAEEDIDECPAFPPVKET